MGAQQQAAHTHPHTHQQHVWHRNRLKNVYKCILTIEPAFNNNKKYYQWGLALYIHVYVKLINVWINAQSNPTWKLTLAFLRYKYYGF